MPHPGITQPDLCSIRAAGQAELAGTARGGLMADGRPPAGDDPPVSLASGIDRAIRLSTAAAVLAVADIAAYVSYGHAYAVVRAHGETGITARLEPATIDGLVYASSISLVGSYELLVWLIRTCGTAECGPPAGHLGTGAACRAARHPVPASAVDGERPGGSERGTSGPAWRPAGRGTGQSPISASGQRDDEALAASACNDAAVAAYRLSVQAGNPLSERRLAQMFGRTSRRWARARIADARQASPLPDSPSTSVMAYR